MLNCGRFGGGALPFLPLAAWSAHAAMLVRGVKAAPGSALRGSLGPWHYEASNPDLPSWRFM